MLVGVSGDANTASYAVRVRLFVVRHAEAAAGEPDELRALTNAGRATAHALGKQFQGLAQLQSRTFTGQISTLRDYVNRFLGDVTFPLFETLRTRTLPLLVNLTQALGEAFKTGGADAMFETLDRMTEANGRVYRSWIFLRRAAEDFWVILTRALLPAARDVLAIFTPLRPALDLAGGALGFLADNTRLTAAMFRLWLYYLVLTRTAMIVNRLWTLRLVAAEMLLRKWTRYLWIDCWACCTGASNASAMRSTGSSPDVALDQ